MFYGPLSEACATRWEWDAHIVAYRCRTVERRLGDAESLAYEPEMVVVVFDVDGPDHRCSPEWWAVEREKVRTLFKARGRGYAYTTRGGYRIIYGLAQPLKLRTPTDALRWRVSYDDWVTLLKTEHAIIADDKCADWTRLFRLPRTKRDGEIQEPVEEIGEASRILDWRAPLCALEDERLLRPQAVVEVTEAPPVSDEQLAIAAKALIDAWPPKGGRHYSGLSLCGALGKAGWSDSAILDFIGYIMLETTGDAELSKWAPTIKTTLDKLARGEEVSGWMSLAKHMRSGVGGQEDESRGPAVDAAILAAQRALGMGPAQDLFASVTGPADVKKLLANAPTFAFKAELSEMRNEVGGGTQFAGLLDSVATDLPPVVEQTESKSKQVDARPMGMTYREMRRRAVPPPEYLIEGLIPKEGVGALAGEPKAAKSWDATYFAVCIAAGRNPYDKFAVQKPARVFYYYAEDGEGSIGNRIAAIAKSLGLDPDGDWADRIVSQPRGRTLDVMNTAHLCVLAASVKQFETTDSDSGGKFALLVLDPLSNIHSGEEDKRDSMVRVMARLHALEAYLGVAVLFIHHSGKDSADNKGRKRGGQKMRGSSAVHGAVDFGIYLSNLRGDQKQEFIARIESEMKAARSAGIFDRKLSIEDNAKGNAERAAFTWSEPEAEGRPKGEDNLAAQRATLVVSKLFEQGAPMTLDDLQKKIKGRRETLIEALDIAITEGWVEQKFHGRASQGFMLTAKGMELYRSGGGSSGPASEPDEPPPAPPGTPNLATMAIGSQHVVR